MKPLRKFGLALILVSIAGLCGQQTVANASSSSTPSFLSELPADSAGIYTDSIHDRGNSAISAAIAFAHPDQNSNLAVPCTQPFGSDSCPTLGKVLSYSQEAFIYYHFGLCQTNTQVSCIQSVAINGSNLSFQRYVGPDPITADSTFLPNWIPQNISLWSDTSGNVYAVNVLSLVNHEYSTEYQAEISRVTDLAGSTYKPITAAEIPFTQSYPGCAYVEMGHCGKKIDFLPNTTISLTTRVTARTDLGHGSIISRQAFTTIANATASSIGDASVISDTITGKPMQVPTFYRVLTGDAAKQAVAKTGGWSQTSDTSTDLRFPWSKVQGPSTWFAKVITSNDCSGEHGIVAINSSDSLGGGYLSQIREPVMKSGNRSVVHVQIAMTNLFASCTFTSAGASWANQVRLWATSEPFYSYPLLNQSKVQDSKWITYSADLPTNAWKQQFTDPLDVELIVPKDHIGSAGNGGYVTTVTTAPKISGLLKVGSKLKVVPGAYLNLNPIKIKGYQWLSCSQPLAQDSYGFSCAIIPKSNSNAYTLKKSDLGNYIVARELWVLPNKNDLSGAGSWSLRSAKVVK